MEPGTLSEVLGKSGTFEKQKASKETGLVCKTLEGRKKKERKMKHKRALEKILQSFKEPEKLPKAIAPIFLEPQNVPCRKWSFLNQVLVALNETTDARGFRQWKEAGRTVKRGSKAFYICAPQKKTVTKKDSESGEEEKLQVTVGFRDVPVFRLEDTEGKELEKDETTKVLEGLPLRNVAEKWNIKVGAEVSNHRLGVCYIKENQPRAISLGVKNIATWLHELVHASDSKLGNLKERGQHWRSETVAELGGATLATVLGLEFEADLGGYYEYIENYARDAKLSVETACVEVLDRTCRAVGFILEESNKLERGEKND